MSKPKVPAKPYFLKSKEEAKRSDSVAADLYRVVEKDGKVSYEFCTTAELSKRLDLSQSYIRFQASHGKYPGSRMCECGHSWLIPTIYADKKAEEDDKS